MEEGEVHQPGCPHLWEVGDKTSLHLAVVVEVLDKEQAVIVELQVGAMVHHHKPSPLMGRPALSR